jgi:hypothetical protein
MKKSLFLEQGICISFSFPVEVALCDKEPGIVCTERSLKSLLRYPELRLAQNRYSAQTFIYLR